MSSADRTRKLLVDTKVRDLGARDQAQIVQLTDCASVEQALKVLAEHKILSAPVVSPEGNSTGVTWPAGVEGADILGFVCVNDILTSFLECIDADGSAALLSASSGRNSSGGAATGAAAPSCCQGRQTGAGEGEPAAAAAAAAAGTMLARMRLLEGMGLAFAQQPLRDLSCKGSDGDFLHARVAGDATLLELVMYGFLDPKRRGMHEGEGQARVVHRVALFDNSGRVTAVISQTDIVRFLARHTAELGELAGATMEQLGWHDKPVACCTPETPALDALRLMVAQGVSSLAVVTGHHQHHQGGQGQPGAQPTAPWADEGQQAAGPAAGHVTGRLLGNFSASEMRAMTAEHFGALSLPVGEFLAVEHDTEYVAANREALLEDGVLNSPAHAFISNRTHRTPPEQQQPQGQGPQGAALQPGVEVGQLLRVVRKETTFKEVLDLLVRHRIHRVYVVDGAQRPVGIVTCTDVLRKVVEVATSGPGLGPAF